MQVIWLNWGLTEQDLHTMPASVINSFGGNFIQPWPPSIDPQKMISLGSVMGSDMGRMLMRGSWNAAIYDDLLPYFDKTNDFECVKNRVSGSWHEDTPFCTLLKDKGIDSLLFTGVNTNQCVLGTLMDCCFQGYDCVLIDDCCGTTTPGGQDLVLIDSSVSTVEVSFRRYVLIVAATVWLCDGLECFCQRSKRVEDACTLHSIYVMITSSLYICVCNQSELLIVEAKLTPFY